MKKFIVLSFTILFALSFTACGMAEKTVSDAESMGDSVISGTQSAFDKAESDLKDDSSADFMADITTTEAKKAALKHAGLSDSQVRDVEIDLDRENGKLVYEIDFKSGDFEYDYTIDADTGEVISHKKSVD